MTSISPDDTTFKRKDFFCGVVEGFYGRPWTTEQRKDLFQKLKKWGMDMYVYAPKDDYKHRAYWRELYTVEEAEHLTSLITAAKNQGITFCYALSPGLDITYSSQKEITALKRKLEQVSQFGCTCFALLFDDIEPEMSEADKQIFQSFAHAQVSITNEIHQHLGCPQFLLCPTQYCSTRAVPTVTTSEYLNTLGTKLSQEIDVMWTGPKVISKTLTTECIEEITQVLRRPPVIWDNLHANDYDQKRLFLGPYCGRSPALIPLLRGVLSNPNCEFHANLPAVRTLATWAGCTTLAATNEAVSWDIKLERESDQGVCEDEAPPTLGKHVYHHRQALKQAINEWLPEFSIHKTAQGPAVKPQPPINIPPVAMVPILPMLNTCMSLTGTNNTSTVSVPTVHTSQLAALTDGNRGPISSPAESINPVSNPVMNSLVSPTTVILNDTIPNPIIPIASSNMALPTELPISTLPISILGLKGLEDTEKIDDNMSEKMESPNNGDATVMSETPPIQSPLQSPSLDLDGDTTAADVNMNDATSENGSMQVEPSNSPLSTDMMVEPIEPVDVVEEPIEDPPTDIQALTADDLLLLCDLFYLPFEHGARGLRLLHDFHWLATHAVHSSAKGNKPETCEWQRRRSRFSWWVSRARRVLRRLTTCNNKELSAELQPYLSELCGVLALLHGHLLWLELGKFPPNATNITQGSYTWFSKGWREAFESGAQEPWVFRGGLSADLRRLVAVDCGETRGEVSPACVRPFIMGDEEQVRDVCHKTCRDGSDCSHLFPSDLQTLPADRLVQPFLILSPEFCMVLEDDSSELTPEGNSIETGVKPEIIGYACAAINCKDFYQKQEMALMSQMREKYPMSLLEREDLSPAAKECIRDMHAAPRAPPPRVPPALLTCAVKGVGGGVGDGVARLLVCLLAALKINGVNGVHVCINSTDLYLHQFYTKLGFTEITQESGRVYLGRNF